MNKKAVKALAITAVVVCIPIAYCIYEYAQTGLDECYIATVLLYLGLNPASEEGFTMARIHEVEIAISRFNTKNDLPPPPIQDNAMSLFKEALDKNGYRIHSRPPSPWPVNEKRRVEKLIPILVPLYAKRLPVSDYWGCPLYFDISADRQHLIVMSLGSDCKPDSDVRSWFPTKETHHDIISFDYVLVAMPEGIAP